MKLEELNKLYIIAQESHANMVLSAPENMSLSAYKTYIGESLDILERISRKIRLSKPAVYTKADSDANRLKLKDFIYLVASSYFKDKDGYGVYCAGLFTTDIEIYADDVYNNSIRQDFTEIIWFNK